MILHQHAVLEHGDVGRPAEFAGIVEPRGA